MNSEPVLDTGDSGAVNVDANVDLGPYATNWYYVEGSDVCTNDGGVDTQTGEYVIHRVHWFF